MPEKPDLAKLTHELAVEMTASTGTLWRAIADPDRWTTTIYTDEAYLALSIDGYSAPYHLKAWASTPRGISPLHDNEVIRMNADRPLAAIAKDITRRILPHARAYLLECQEHQKQLDYQERKENLIKKALSRYLQYITFTKSFCTEDYKIHSVEIRTDTIEMRLTVTPAEAIKVCKLLKG